MTETLVFLHGFGGSKEIWKWQKEYFSQYFPVLAFDLPGHGGQKWNQETLDIMADQICLTLQQSGVEKAIFVVSSLGGLLALRLYEKNPDCISKIIFVGSLPKFTREKNYHAGLTMEKIDHLSGQIQKTPKVALDVFIRSLYTFKERSSKQYADNKQIWKDIRNAPDSQALLAMLDILKTTDLRQAFQNTFCPVFFIFGDQDYICPSPVAVHLKNMKPDVNVFFMKDCGHLPFLSSPKEFNVLLEKMIRGLI